MGQGGTAGSPTPDHARAGAVKVKGDQVRSRTASPAPGALQARGLRKWWLDRSLRVKGLIVVALPLIALTGVGAANLVLQQNESGERAVSTSARNLAAAAQLVLADTVNAETGVRGYAATRDPLFLAPYDLALARIGAERRSLSQAAVAEGDGGQQRAVDVTMGRALSELAPLRSGVRSGIPAGTLRSGLERENTTMDLLRQQVASLADGPAALVIAQRSKITALQSRIEVLDIAGLILGLLAGLAGMALFASGIASRVAANQENARRLGEGQPLEPVTHAGDEIGRAADSHLVAGELLARRTAELTAARDTALKATQAKNTFLSSTSHELRTPLNSILGFAQLLQMSQLSDEDNDGVTRILGAGRHLLALINELIDIARIESGDLSLSVEPVLVGPLVEEASRLMAPIAAERSIAIIQDCAHPALAARADRQRLSQVLVNLISNAVKYNHRDGRITISCRAEGAGRAVIVVSDTGPGLSAENIERIFLPFERLGAERTAVEGTGIGLPLARSLTEAMGGQLTAVSVLGQGAAFTVSLPRAPDLVHVPAPAPAPEPPAAGRVRARAGISILYIEDNPANIELVSRFLHARPNTRLTSAASGRAGIECAARDRPDIILLDLHLPDLDGDEVLRELRADPATAAIPVAVLSADASRGVIHRLLAGGALAYLTKPIELAELAGLLDTFAARPQDQQAQRAVRITPA
jgi:signal transduction histidine kinase/ActR/RegA family two-component response regulator